MLFYGHTASFPLRLAAIAGISLGATLLSILSPFGLSEADSPSSTWNGRWVKPSRSVNPIPLTAVVGVGWTWPLLAQALAFGSHFRE